MMRTFHGIVEKGNTSKNVMCKKYTEVLTSYIDVHRSKVEYNCENMWKRS